MDLVLQRTLTHYLAEEICERISESISQGEPIHEIDHWTVWEAQKENEEASA